MVTMRAMDKADRGRGFQPVSDDGGETFKDRAERYRWMILGNHPHLTQWQALRIAVVVVADTPAGNRRKPFLRHAYDGRFYATLTGC